MAITIDFDIGEWLNLEDAVKALINNVPRLKKKFFEDVQRELSRRIDEQIETQNINDTGTYQSSLNVELVGNDEDLSLHIGFIPVGIEAARLPIYWKVLEFGSKPIPLIPRLKLADWGSRKFGNPLFGFKVASLISKYGVLPHPILSRFFILSVPDGNIIGLTTETNNIIISTGQNILSGMEKIYSSVIKTRRVVARVSGKFAPL